MPKGLAIAGPLRYLLPMIMPQRPSLPASPFAAALQNVKVGDAAPGEIEAFAAQLARSKGMDPSVVLRVIRGEGGFRDPYQPGLGPAPRSQNPAFGPKEHSFGPLQLYISGTGAGLGDRALAAGIDPRKDWKAGLNFGLDEAKAKGWGQWYGAKAAGITGFAGINGNPVGPAPSLAGARPNSSPSGPPTRGKVDNSGPQSLGSQIASAILGDGGNSALRTPEGGGKGSGISFGSPNQTAPAELPQVAPAQKRDLSGLVEQLAQGQTESLKLAPPQVKLRALAAYGAIA